MSMSWSDRRLRGTDRAACRQRLRGGSRSFFAASLLLPSRYRNPARALYAFCRVADDAIDLGLDRQAALADLHRRLARIYAGVPAPCPEDRAFACVVEAYKIPRALPEALLEGFEWDARGRRYETLSDVQAYAARVAGSVGVMMALIMGARDAPRLARACELGIAMQLTNIARDVGEDAAAGRIYLPRLWMREAGVEPEAWLAAPKSTPMLNSVVQRLLKKADLLYARADVGIAGLPAACRPAIRAARLLYSAIGHQIERCDVDPLAERVVVPHAVKIRLMGRSLMVQRVSPCSDAPLEEAQFLVDAVPSCAPATAPHQPRPGFATQVRGVLQSWERLERRDRGLEVSTNETRLVNAQVAGH